MATAIPCTATVTCCRKSCSARAITMAKGRARRSDLIYTHFIFRCGNEAAPMAFEVKWYVEGRVSTARDWGEFTLEEMKASNVISLEHIRTGTPPVHLLIDTRAISKL